MGADSEPHMRVYRNRVVLVLEDGRELTFDQGPMSQDAQDRYKRIDTTLKDGWLEKTVGAAMSPAAATTLSPDWVGTLERMAGAITSDSGRAMTAITVIQMAVKAIEPGQSIRLTKGKAPAKGPAKGKKSPSERSDDFSWVEGMSMRGLSSRYFVPFLRRYELVFGNKYGPFMTRGYAENYPYSPLYKAVLRGPRKDWDKIVEGLESGALDPKDAFILLCSLLANRSQEFRRAAAETTGAMRTYLGGKPTLAEVKQLISAHIAGSINPARLLEVAAHSLLQALYTPVFGAPSQLRPLTQMRSANLKAGNVGDVEVIQSGSSKVLEAWDAKAGSLTLDVELRELKDKLARNRGVVNAGFILDRPPRLGPENKTQIADIRKATGTDVEILPIDAWVDAQIVKSKRAPESVATEWLRAYTESLCQMRRDMAPIDEPSGPWVEGLRQEFERRTERS